MYSGITVAFITAIGNKPSPIEKSRPTNDNAIFGVAYNSEDKVAIPNSTIKIFLLRSRVYNINLGEC